jgi:hypothetical protein
MNAFIKHYDEVRNASLTAVNPDSTAKPFSWNPLQVPTLQDAFFAVECASITVGGAYIPPLINAAKHSV